MELLFRRHFWAVWLVFLALSSTLVARTANSFVASALSPAPDLGLAGPPRGAWVPPPVPAQVDETKFGHLFGIDPPPPPADPLAAAAQNAPKDTRVCYTCAPVKSNLRLQLLATMVANEEKWSMALITDLDKQSTSYYFIGDPVKNAVVYDIQREPQRVVIVNNDTHRLEYIDSVPGSGAANVGIASLGTSPLPYNPMVGNAYASNAPLSGVTHLGGTSYDITRGRLNATLGNLNQVATQARIVPSFQNGVANGFKLFSIQPGSIYSAIGIENGDVITRINGYDINSPDKALEIYQRLKDAQNVDLQVDRHGETLTYHYSIR